MEMFCKGGFQLRTSALPLTMAAVSVVGASVALSSATAASASESASASVPASATAAASASGVWPGVGKICEPGPGGTSSVRGVGAKTINIAVFNDAANTIEPGLEAEFPQQ